MTDSTESAVISPRRLHLQLAIAGVLCETKVWMSTDGVHRKLENLHGLQYATDTDVGIELLKLVEEHVLESTLVHPPKSRAFFLYRSKDGTEEWLRGAHTSLSQITTEGATKESPEPEDSTTEP